MLRTLESEYPKVLGKVVDFDATLAPPVMAQHIVDELLADDGSYEIGYPAGQRSQYLATRTPLAATTPHAWRPQAGWVVLVTGGARGITAEISGELAQPGVHLVVVGRAPLGGAEATFATDDATLETDLATLRSQLIAAQRAQGVERTPAEIESEARALQREHERRRNLAAFAAAGAQVEYHALDVRTESAFGALIDDLYRRFGRIDAVVHGAGIIEDRQIEEKSAASFDRVFDTKADSAFILGQHLRAEGLRWVVFFSSVAGRFGNQGQVDYAAANEVVNRLACQFDAQWPATRVAAINWGPWRGAGMANQGIQRQFVAKGITPIEAVDGVRFFVDELTYGQKGEVEVIAGEGPWKVEADQQMSTILELGALFLGSHQLSEHG
jgi:NAD(P)-dependent dehydrogenase (short-subunit alcohol dehydrogenase family)